MKSIFYAGAALLAISGIAGAANAATITLVESATEAGHFTGTFSQSHNGAFTDTWTFGPLPAGVASASLINIAFDAIANIDFTSVTLNGVDLVINNGDPVATASTGSQFFITDGAINTLVVSGMAGSAASYSGTVNYALQAVPEPATWAMMIAGFGIVGSAMRRRRATVAFA